MSVCDPHRAHLDPDDLDADPLTADDAWEVARAVMHDERLPEDERVRLVWAVLDTARFGLSGDKQ